MNVVSLLPSATEIVYALGIEPVGVSHECDYPPAANEQPAVNRSQIDAEATSGEIDEQVLAAQEEGGVYELDRETLATFSPDLVVSQGICDVCAVDEVRVRQAVDELGLEAAVLTTDPHSLADMLADIERIGDALGRNERAVELVSELEGRIDVIERAAGATEGRPRTAVLDWLDPVMVAGHWIPGIVDLAGGRYGLAERGASSRPREWEAIRSYDPEVLVLAPCGFNIEQTTANLADVTGRDGWEDLTAVQRDEVYVVDGHHYVNRPGPRLVETLEFLAWILHPEQFDTPPVDAVQPLATLEA
jgi:iron complex transport system substrate-binding protein